MNTCNSCYSVLTSGGVCPRCDHATTPRDAEIVVRCGAEDVIEAARTSIGFPFRHMGRDESGMDCIGLLFWVGEKTGLVKNLGLPDYFYHMNYSRVPTYRGPDSNWLLRELCATFPRKAVGDIEASDIVYFRNQKWVHLGIVTPDTMVHAYAASVRKVVEHSYSKEWKNKTVAAFSWPGVT